MMNIRAAGWRKFRLDQIHAEPWRNGGGLTRMLAADAPGDDFLWRVSVADIEHSGAFSLFPGIDRTAMLMGGNALSLHGEAMQVYLQQEGDVAQFAGETPLQATLESGPARLCNVMTRRGRALCSLELRSNAVIELNAAIELCVVLDGSYQLRMAGNVVCTLDAGEGLIVTRATAQLQLTRTTSAGRLISARIALSDALGGRRIDGHR